MTTPIVTAEQFAEMTGLTVDEARRELEDFGVIEPTNTVTVDELPDCNFCTGTNPTPAKYDARIHGGSWGYVCQTHFMAFGCELGTGKGQMLVIE